MSQGLAVTNSASHASSLKRQLSSLQSESSEKWECYEPAPARVSPLCQHTSASEKPPPPAQGGSP